MGCGASSATPQPTTSTEDNGTTGNPADTAATQEGTAGDHVNGNSASLLGDSNTVETEDKNKHENSPSQQGKHEDESERSINNDDDILRKDVECVSRETTKDIVDHVTSQNNGDHVGRNGDAHLSPQPSNDNKLQQPEEVQDEDSDMAVAQEPSRLQVQEQFTAALRLAGSLMTSESIMSFAGPDVEQLTLSRALPSTCRLNALLAKLPNLKIVDLSNNNLGPPGFRALMLALCHNSTIVSLNVASNMADTDSSESIGRMLKSNRCLSLLDVSHNNLGKDYFSRCVGPALPTNNALVTLRCESVGSTDLSHLAAGIAENTSLGELSVSHNQLSNPKAFTEKLTTALKRPECGLQCLQMKNCNLQDADVLALVSAIRLNTSLRKLVLTGAQVDGSSSLLELLVGCVGHPALHTLEADDVTAGAVLPWNPDPSHKPTSHCAIESLTLSNCGLTDDLLKSLVEFLGTAAMPELRSVVLTNNPQITMEGLNAVLRLATSKHSNENITGTECHLEQLSWGLNSADGLPSVVASGHLPHLRYLNLRKARTSPAVVSQLRACLGSGGVDTLVLDGIKLAGSEALQEMLGAASSCSLTALSLSGCSLADRDIGLLTDALKNGLPLRMLKLSANRISGRGISQVVDALLSQPAPPLKLMDLANNQIDTAGAKLLSTLFTTASHKSSIHSLNLTGNAIGSEGLVALVSLLNKGPLISLHLSSQSVTYEEEDMEDITQALATALGFSYDRRGDEVKAASCAVSNPPIGLNVKLMQLGGNPGELAKHLDSAAITTDFSQNRLPYFTLEQSLQLAAAFKGHDLSDGRCLFSREDWNYVISADKDAPSWLQVPEELSKALYLSHLPASISIPKLEGIMENDVDTIVQEVYLLKDAVSQKNNGLAWALMEDEAGVAAAKAYVQSGEARVFGQSFLMSSVNALIDDDGDTQATERARRDMADRAAMLRAEQGSHRRLIQQSYHESQERHAYRLAHPAYADGRIW